MHEVISPCGGCGAVEAEAMYFPLITRVDRLLRVTQIVTATARYTATATTSCPTTSQLQYNRLCSCSYSKRRSHNYATGCTATEICLSKSKQSEKFHHSKLYSWRKLFSKLPYNRLNSYGCFTLNSYSYRKRYKLWLQQASQLYRNNQLHSQRLAATSLGACLQHYSYSRADTIHRATVDVRPRVSGEEAWGREEGRADTIWPLITTLTSGIGPTSTVYCHCH